MAFATPDDVVTRVDYRWLALFVLDEDAPASLQDVLDSTRLAAALEDAAGLILMYTRQGGRYTLANLTDLTGPSASLLVRMNVDLAATLLAEARQVPSADIEKTIPGYGRTMSLLQQLSLGNVIFDVPAVADAGVPHLAYRGRHALGRSSNIICHLSRLVGDVAKTEAQNDGQFPGCCNQEDRWP